ncbi:hypothetical protein KC19_11G120100 [Ceratodon purpureus]|uniref:Uncharacterized protein n=1 Tax=Ceratodon purpureus TaxID=3225 RepID=A0A8T0GE73_CERPU|nr:hypothetical protein KC19_11G120100 [Ceratodon purpureus]
MVQAWINLSKHNQSTGNTTTGSTYQATCGPPFRHQLSSPATIRPTSASEKNSSTYQTHTTCPKSTTHAHQQHVIATRQQLSVLLIWDKGQIINTCLALFTK